ncbi:hypothetical protein CLF_102764 [Clonorchis sinensis]|uniref:Uncharacterized protein n=1 Tax=Clonorchis sinensis TaxID=79923 RepID=G7Y8G8_CLOSI|nr:hypothetical protein CLF_102764 [Clonorchis sinensis]
MLCDQMDGADKQELHPLRVIGVALACSVTVFVKIQLEIEFNNRAGTASVEEDGGPTVFIAFMEMLRGTPSFFRSLHVTNQTNGRAVRLLGSTGLWSVSPGLAGVALNAASHIRRTAISPTSVLFYRWLRDYHENFKLKNDLGIEEDSDELYVSLFTQRPNEVTQMQANAAKRLHQFRNRSHFSRDAKRIYEKTCYSHATSVVSTVTRVVPMKIVQHFLGFQHECNVAKVFANSSQYYPTESNQNQKGSDGSLKKVVVEIVVLGKPKLEKTRLPKPFLIVTAFCRIRIRKIEMNPSKSSIERTEHHMSATTPTAEVDKQTNNQPTKAPEPPIFRNITSFKSSPAPPPTTITFDLLISSNIALIPISQSYYDVTNINNKLDHTCIRPLSGMVKPCSLMVPRVQSRSFKRARKGVCRKHFATSTNRRNPPPFGSKLKSSVVRRLIDTRLMVPHPDSRRNSATETEVS